MKIWRSYGSEHSMNLVMIGQFESGEAAKWTKGLIDELAGQLRDKINIGTLFEQYSQELLDALMAAGCYSLSPSDLEDLQSEKTIAVEGDRITISTDEMSAAAFSKLMVTKGAKVQALADNHHKNEKGENVTQLIGRFKNVGDAENTRQTINSLAEELREKMGIGSIRERYNDEALKVLRKRNCYILRPSELEHFLYDTTTRLEKDKIIIETDESEVSAFFKLMVKGGANVEMFSAHDYPMDESRSEK